MHGPPGGGKTSLARALARGAQAAFVALDAAETFSSFLGEAERAVRDAFATARANRPCIVFLDELDALVTKRDMGDGGSSGGGAAETMAARVLSTLLNEMDGVEAADGVLVVAATNRIDRIDAALMRPGRFDHVILVPPPDAATAEAVIRAHARRMPLGPGVDLAAVATRARAALGPAASGAQLANVCREAAMHALRRARAARLPRERVFVEAEDFHACIDAEAGVGAGPVVFTAGGGADKAFA
jgi:SpoVK/Ycf46/Vps4 family AAA+-type ATPase